MGLVRSAPQKIGMKGGIGDSTGKTFLEFALLHLSNSNPSIPLVHNHKTSQSAIINGASILVEL